MKFARAITDGVICDKPTEFLRGQLLIQRAVDSGGDSILVTADGNKGERTAYIVPTAAIKRLLNEPLQRESEAVDE